MCWTTEVVIVDEETLNLIHKLINCKKYAGKYVGNGKWKACVQHEVELYEQRV